MSVRRPLYLVLVAGGILLVTRKHGSTRRLGRKVAGRTARRGLRGIL